MRIVQTFWTAGKDPLKHSFGWSHPEYNLMSWALSCLSLREHYDEVALYTDQEGYDVLINKLHLPYTEVNVVYDKNLCLPQHWAYAKIKTYGMQTKPFLHVDGDVYLPHPIPEDIANAPLVAQNREIGTHYYRSMIDRLLSYPEIILPEYVQRGLAVQSVPSYNMGIFGGSDLDFIQRYCKEVEDFMQVNNMNDLSEKCSRVRCNVFFEQVIMGIMADNEEREITSVHEKAVKDMGYSSREFCFLEKYEEKQFFHLLGGHKKARYNCDQLEKVMLRLYSSYFARIIHLFESSHRRLCKAGGHKQEYDSVERSIARYEDIRESKSAEWDLYDIDKIIETDKAILDSHDFFMASSVERADFFISTNPYLYIYQLTERWHPKAVELMNQRFKCEKEYPLDSICLFPVLLHDGIKEVPVVEFQQRIISLLKEKPMRYYELETELMDGFTLKSEKSRSGAKKLIYDQISNILKQGVLIASKKDRNINL
jgi:hypothetical protein